VSKPAKKPATPKKPVKTSKPTLKKTTLAKPLAKPKEPAKKAPALKTSVKPPAPQAKPQPKPVAKLPRPVIKPKQPTGPVRPVDAHREPERFIGSRHSLVHHFAHDDKDHHRYSFDRNWWWNFVEYPELCDDGLDQPADYYAGGDQGPWVNYETLVPPADADITPPAINDAEGLPISRAGAVLANQLAAMQVESHWLPGQNVNWQTGDAIDGNPGPASNGAEFVAAVGARLEVPMPPAVPGNFSPDSQYDWLVNQGTGVGWVAVGDVEAQLLANQGWVVVAAWKSPTPGIDRSTDGQTAIVRPDGKPVEAVAAQGPTIAVAGLRNHSAIGLEDAFPQAAWNQVVYLASRPRW
jgi:hypothetical protein